MSKKWLSIFGMTTMLFLVSCCRCPASGLNERLRQDFRPIEATVIDVAQDTVTIDSGLSDGISKGNLFSLFQKGRPVFMPDSRKILGFEQKKVGVCTVTEVRQNSSICKMISPESAPEKGDLAVRFGELNAAFFVEHRPSEPELPGGSLQDILPWLKWLEPATAPSPVLDSRSMNALGIDILFQVKGNRLFVYGPGMTLLNSYNLPPSFVFTNENEKESPDQQGDGAVKTQLQGIQLFDFGKAKIIGKLNRDVLQVQICDLDGDGQLEIIYLMKDELCIAPYRRQGEISFKKFSYPACACSFSVMPGTGWICVNVSLSQAGMTSNLLQYLHDSLKTVQDQINLWLAFIDSDCDGNKDILLGQSYDRDRFKGKKIFLLAPRNYGIEYIERADYPADFNINSAVTAKIGQDTCSLFYVSFDGFFKVFGKGRHLWSSLKPVVSNTKCCGPANADLIDLSRTGAKDSGIIFNGTIPLPKSRFAPSLLLFTEEDGQYVLYQAEVNQHGTIRGISVVNGAILAAVSKDTQVNHKNPQAETVIYTFPIP